MLSQGEVPIQSIISGDEVFVTLRMSIADRTLQLCDIEQNRTRFIRLLSCLGTFIYEIFINRSHIAMLSPSSSSGSGLAIDLYS